MASVARAVLGAPASSAVLERNFGEFDKLVERRSSSLSRAYMEMLMFLRCAEGEIPDDIPRLSPEAYEAAIPARLKDPRKRAEAAIHPVMMEDAPHGEEVDGGVVGDFF